MWDVLLVGQGMISMQKTLPFQQMSKPILTNKSAKSNSKPFVFHLDHDHTHPAHAATNITTPRLSNQPLTERVCQASIYSDLSQFSREVLLAVECWIFRVATLSQDTGCLLDYRCEFLRWHQPKMTGEALAQEDTRRENRRARRKTIRKR